MRPLSNQASWTITLSEAFRAFWSRTIAMGDGRSQDIGFAVIGTDQGTTTKNAFSQPSSW
jgi:hypothetical protein